MRKTARQRTYDYTYRKNKKFLDAKTIMGLDRYGYPATQYANQSLLEFDDFGDSAKQLEESWYEWLQYNPFDTAVAQKLAQLYRKRMKTINPDEDADRLNQIKKKLQLTENRTSRYSL